MSGYTLPEKPYGDFKCLAQGVGDYSLDVMSGDTKDYGVMMIICASEEAVYISREQAAVFFGFRDCHSDLLEALKLYQDAGFGQSTDYYKQGLAYYAAAEAIAKAEGRS